MYKIVLSNIAEKALDKLPDDIVLKIHSVIQKLKENPRPLGCLKLSGSEGFRIKVGDYRILYTIKDKILEIYIFKIAHRKDAYRKK